MSCDEWTRGHLGTVLDGFPVCLPRHRQVWDQFPQTGACGLTVPGKARGEEEHDAGID